MKKDFLDLLKKLFEAPAPRKKFFDWLGFQTFIFYYGALYIMAFFFPYMGNGVNPGTSLGKNPLAKLTLSDGFAYSSIAISIISLFGLAFYHLGLTVQFRSPKYKKLHVEEVQIEGEFPEADIHWLRNYRVASIISMFFLVRSIGYFVTDSYRGIIFSGTGLEVRALASGVLAFSAVFVLSMFVDFGKVIRPRNGLLLLVFVLVAESVMRFC